MKVQRFLLQLSALLLMTGCASSLTGITGGDFACKAPDGVQCQSVSGNYANAIQNNLPAYRKNHYFFKTADSGSDLPAGDRFANARQSPAAQASAAGSSSLKERIDPPSAGGPMRSSPRILRIWSAPWEDADGSFHDQSYSYITVDPGRWLVENALYRIRDHYTQPVLTTATEQPRANKPAEEVSAKTPDIKTPAAPITSLRALKVRPLQEETGSPQGDAPGSRAVIIRPLSRDSGKAGN